ncbi:MAG TPA: LysM peptidoglycan-binding domain-containing protein [Anaerolineaceae bacterium]|nr:LysM peptidoglycan-binding domain-containing protein [Anaerolineaceae bacterium]
MKKNWIVVSLVFLIMCLAVTRPVHAAPLLIPTAYELIDAVNAYRAANGLAPLVIDSLLMISAQTHAEYLASQSGALTGHVGVGGTDADARAAALGYPQVPGLDINENWANLPASADLDVLLFTAWGDSQHTHTMLHTRGQHVGAGVAVSGDNVVYVLNVAAFWGDAGLTVQPTSGAYPGISGGNSTGASISQYIAPVEMAEPDESGKVIHQVLQGQTLWSIATTYGVTIDHICQLNGLTSESMIYTGQKLLIKMVPTPSLVPTITIGIHLENQFPVVTTTAPLLAAQPSTRENRQPLSDQWVIMGIIVVAIIGFALIFLGQRSSQ